MEKYIPSELVIIEFTADDIITTSLSVSDSDDSDTKWGPIQG